MNVFLGFSEKLFGIMKFTQLEIIFSFTAIKGRKFALVKRMTIISGSLWQRLSECAFSLINFGDGSSNIYDSISVWVVRCKTWFFKACFVEEGQEERVYFTIDNWIGFKVH